MALLRETGLLDAPTEAAFDRLAALAAKLLNAPLATVTLIDADRQFYTACVGLPEPLSTTRETPLDVSFCRLAVADAAADVAARDTMQRATPLAIPDTRLDVRTRDMASVTHFGVLAYAGVALVVEGQPVGTVCVMDVVPRAWTSAELDVLVDLGGAATTEVELRVANRRLQATASAATAARDALAVAYGQLQAQQRELERAHMQLQEQQASLAVGTDQLQRQHEALEVQAGALRETTARLEVEIGAAIGARRDADAARADAEHANRAKRDFLAAMSHELRTPLNAIQGYTSLLTLGIRGPVTDGQRQDLERVQRANRHLMGLVTDILNFAQLEAAEVEYHLEDFELATVLGDVESLVGPQLAARSLRFMHEGLIREAAEQSLRARVDPEKLLQILLNLLTNAIKFTDAGGLVTLRGDADDAHAMVRLRVSDTGRGISPTQLDRVFEPFVQVDRSRTPASDQGVGLGLAISRNLARGMGGDLVAESTPGAGSTFTLTLPRA